MPRSQYVTMLQGKYGDERYVRWELPLKRGWSYIHGERVRDGEVMVWLLEAVAEDDRWEAGVRGWFKERKEEVRSKR